MLSQHFVIIICIIICIITKNVHPHIVDLLWQSNTREWNPALFQIYKPFLKTSLLLNSDFAEAIETVRICVWWCNYDLQIVAKYWPSLTQQLWIIKLNSKFTNHSSKLLFCWPQTLLGPIRRVNICLWLCKYELHLNIIAKCWPPVTEQHQRMKFGPMPTPIYPHQSIQLDSEKTKEQIRRGTVCTEQCTPWGSCLEPL